MRLEHSDLTECRRSWMRCPIPVKYLKFKILKLNFNSFWNFEKKLYLKEGLRNRLRNPSEGRSVAPYSHQRQNLELYKKKNFTGLGGWGRPSLPIQMPVFFRPRSVHRSWPIRHARDDHRNAGTSSAKTGEF